VFLELLFTAPAFYLQHVFIMAASIILHEWAHGLEASRQGDDTPRRSGHFPTFNPLIHLGGLSLMFLCVFGLAWGRMPVNPARFRDGARGDVSVSIAGPVCNLLLACVAMSCFAHLPEESAATDFFYIMALANMSLFLFNMMPVPPLDGFGVLKGFVPGLGNASLAHNPAHQMVLFFLLISLLSAPLHQAAQAMVNQGIGLLWRLP
jgi:Zn-dependent protease